MTLSEIKLKKSWPPHEFPQKKIVTPLKNLPQKSRDPVANKTKKVMTPDAIRQTPYPD